MLLSHLRTHLIFSANTDVGKTIFATALVRATANASPSTDTFYLKPVSTGPARDADYRCLSLSPLHHCDIGASRHH